MAKSAQYSRSVLGASDEIKDIYCEPCHRDGHVAIAEGYCKDCPEYLCAQCYKSHRRNKVLANHVLLDKDSMPTAPGSIRTVLDICKEKCTLHSDKVIELFCETCDKLGCTICITLDHRQCRNVKHIPDIIKDLKTSQEFTAFYEHIKSTIDSLSEFEQKMQANATSNNDMQKLAKQELKRQRAEVNTFFDELERKMDDQILMMEKRNKDALKAASDTLKPMKKELDQIKNNIESKKSGQNCELFISMKKSKEKMRTLDNQFNNMQGELTIHHYTMLPSEQIQTMMRTVTEICKISTSMITAEVSKTPATRTTTEVGIIPATRTTTEVSKTTATRSTTEVGRMPATRTTAEVCTASLQAVIDIKTSKDKKKPSIHGLTIMHGHYYVVSDSNNKSIKVVNTKSKQVTSEKGIESWTIWGVTSVSDDQVVVSVTMSEWSYQIQVFSVSTSGVIRSTNQVINVDNFYKGMVHCKGNIYGVCGLTNAIDILSMKGKIIRTIKTDDKGANLFDFLGRIALSPNGQTIYVTDSLKNSVISLTLDGKVKAIYTNQDLKDPCGITVDRHGYVYVGSLGTHNIQQLTADLNKVKVIIDNAQGCGITYSSTEHKLYMYNKEKINEYSLNFK